MKRNRYKLLAWLAYTLVTGVTAAVCGIRGDADGLHFGAIMAMFGLVFAQFALNQQEAAKSEAFDRLEGFCVNADVEINYVDGGLQIFRYYNSDSPTEEVTSELVGSGFSLLEAVNSAEVK